MRRIEFATGCNVATESLLWVYNSEFSCYDCSNGKRPLRPKERIMTGFIRATRTSRTCVPGKSCHCPPAYSSCRYWVRFNTAQFTWNKPERTGSAFASDLGIRANVGMPNVFTITNPDTGVRLIFTQTTADVKDGDLRFARYVAAHLTTFVTVTIFND